VQASLLIKPIYIYYGSLTAANTALAVGVAAAAVASNNNTTTTSTNNNINNKYYDYCY
jgi:hypothetical protein